MSTVMSFEEFNNAVKEGIKAYLPESFSDAHVQLHMVVKNNNLKLTGLVISKIGRNIAPTIYLDSFYEKYRAGEEINMIMREIAKLRIETEEENDFDLSSIMILDRCRDKIMPRLIGTEHNKETLAECPYISVADLAVTFVIELDNMRVGENIHATITVKNDLMELWGMTKEQLYELALDNLNKKTDCYFVKMQDMIYDLMLPHLLEQSNGDEEEAKKLFEMGNAYLDDLQMYVLTNADKNCGANMVLSKAAMKQVIDRVGTEFYILPSSVHEVLIVKGVNYNKDELKNMVMAVNQQEVSVDEQLSDNVYRYTEETGLVIA